MAKKALLDVLEQTIGKYVRNLDAESLNVAVWSGKIALTNLELDVDAVNAELDRQAAEAPNLAVPLEVISGQFESLEVDVPWASLTSRSVVLRATGLQVHVRPYDRLATTDHLHASVTSEEARATRIRTAREQSIQLSEKYRQQAAAVRKLAVDNNNTGNELTKQSSFSSRLVRRILENIQIEIQNVHISLTDAEGSAGVVLETLSLVTTDKDGKRVFVDRTTGQDQAFLYKELLLEGLGVYLDHQDSSTEKYVMAKTSLGSISETSATSDDGTPKLPTPAPIPKHSYVLAPLSFQAKLRQADGNSCVDYAKYKLSSELSSLSILLSRHQLELARRIAHEVSASKNMAPCPLFPEYRPLTRVTSGPTAREWWKYAVRSIGRLNGRRSWIEFFYAYQKRKQYIPLYKRLAHHATCTWIKPLSNSELETLIQLEQDRTISVEGLMAWRTIADGQVEKEQEKRLAKLQDRRESTSYFSSIFGSKVTVEPSQDEEPPVHLSLDELKELEALSKEQFEDPELSKDSKLCDIQFVLNALKINLTSYDFRHLAALEMGAVSVEFAAAANGAFQFEFDLAALEIQDRVTPNSLFPSVLKSLQSQKTAFHLHLSKTKTGDQTLKLQLAAFEAVASHLLFKEIQRFVAASSTIQQTSAKRKNPILTQSLSGSIDLFYDADQGASIQIVDDTPSEGWNLTSPRGADIVTRHAIPSKTKEISNVLVDAWKEKTVKKAAWLLDVDIKAPVLLIPEKCNDPRASILVFDLGHLKFTYGKVTSPARIVSWFRDHPRDDDEVSFDFGNLAINDLTFQVAKANDWRLSNIGCSNQESSVIDPISLSLDFGVETVSHSTDPPRVCCIGVIPTISLRMSPIQGNKIISVIGSWTGLLSGLSEEPADLHDSILDTTEVDHEATQRFFDDDDVSTSDDVLSEQSISAQPTFYFLIGLQRLSVTISLDARNRVEAHLISVFASTQLMVDGSTVIGLRMGWFWILDMLESVYARKQRLLAHSNLPRPPDTFALESNYDILSELKTQGVFEADYSGSTELADISYRKIGARAIRIAQQRNEQYVESTLDATFSTLFVHWNPHAVKGVSSMIERFSILADDYDDATTLITSPEVMSKAQKTSLSIDKDHPKTLGQMRINARMHRLDFNLNSARDDLPLFVLTVSETEVSMLSSDGNMETSLSLGDIRVRTPEEMGRTLKSYRTLLGLAPGRKESLLTVNYRQGKEAIEKLKLPKQTVGALEAFAEVELSPMRLCFIQSQIMALVEYSTEGILGALTAKAASSAAQRAIELADAVDGEKLFRVKATSLDLVLPQAAHSENIIRIHAGSLDVEYFMFPGTGGSKANVELSNVAMHDSDDDVMQEKPIRMSLNVVLPSYDSGTIEDQAMIVDIFMSDASFLVSKSQYFQMLQTLNENTSELELFLRDDDLSPNERSVSDAAPQGDPTNILTHAGTEFVDKQRRMNLNVTVEVLALQLCDAYLHPIVQIAAVNATINFQSHPDVGTKLSQISLRNLVCEDRRKAASQRQYRYLIRQNQTDADSEDIFFVGYKSSSNETSLELKVGSPHVVLIPDAMSEILAFVKQEGMSERGKPPAVDKYAAAKELPTNETLRVTTSNVSDDIEMTLVQTGPTILSQISATTNTCRIVLVDLGSQITREPGQQSQLTETLVLQGIFAASIASTTDVATGTIVDSQFNGQADSMEIFSSFGKKMQSPLQILEPSDGSLHGSMKTLPHGAIEVEVRAAALTPFDFTVSMHNAALLSAIVNSLKALFMSDDNSSNKDEIDLHGLTKYDAEHIENLAFALETPPDKPALGYQASISSVGDTSGGISALSMHDKPQGTKIQVKVTMPEIKLTVINDLQGLDEALFRASVMNFVAGAKLNRYGFPDMMFDFQLNTSILADYFDTACNIWNNLLVQPWEITLKGLRAPSGRFHSERLTTTVDLESFPCYVSFSEQFLVSLASASRMWSIYSVATAVHVDEDNSSQSGSLKASMAASAARNLVTSMPYAIENHTGIDVSFTLPGGEETRYPCGNGSIQYFRFEPPRGRGYGGRRAYGQDLSFEKSITIYFADDHTISIGHLDDEFGLPRKRHRLKGGHVMMTYVIKEGKTTVLHLTSHVSVVNNTSLSFSVSLEDGVAERPIGTCVSYNLRRGNDTPLIASENGIASKESKSFNVPVVMLTPYHHGWLKDNYTRLNLSISPLLPGQSTPILHGIIVISASLDDLKKSSDGTMISKFDVVCSPDRSQTRVSSPLIVQVVQKTTLTKDNEAQIDVTLEPRAMIENKFPIKIHLRTPMPHTFSSSPHEEVLGKDVIYSLDTGDRVEVFTPGPSIAMTMKTADTPIAGSVLDWLDGGWIDLPLVSEFSLLEPLRCQLPFTTGVGSILNSSAATGSEFFIAEGAQSLGDLATLEEDKRNKSQSPKTKQFSPPVFSSDTPLRAFYITVCYYGIDHTGDVLFEQVPKSDPVLKIMSESFNDSRRGRRHSRAMSASGSKVTPFSAFGSTRHQRRITLLPSGNVPLRVLQMTMEEAAGFRRSLPFFVEELPIGEGGVDTIPIMWENENPSGYYAYRSILNEHQSEVHIVPEFLVFNGSSHIVLVKERGQPEVIVESSKVSQLGVNARQSGLEIALYFTELDCRTPFIRVDKLGMKMVLIKTIDGMAVGSVCVQTVIDNRGDSRLVVKIGEIDTGNLGDGLGAKATSLFRDDFFRFRVRWTELQLILNELQKPDSSSWSVAKALSKWNMTPSGQESRTKPAHELPTKIQASPGEARPYQPARFHFVPGKSQSGEAERRTKVSEILQQPVASITFSRFTFDFQRVFKDQGKQPSNGLGLSPERSQISVVVHNVIIKDLTPDSVFPMVFDSSSPHCSFLDLCVRIRGPLDAEMVQVDLFDLNLAHSNGISEKIKLTTSEDYVWRIIDLANRIMAASGDFAGYALKLVEDNEHGGFIVKIEDTSKVGIRTASEYSPPKSDTLYDINVVKVSPFCLLVSFKRNPQIDRYKKVNLRVGGALMNYFSRKLKFTIDRAELNFARYEDRSLKGPPDRLIESLVAVYTSRMKFKLVTLLTSASLQDWKYLAARGSGDDEYVEGDLLRATGNLTGKASHLIFKRVGETLGDGVSDFSRAVGSKIEMTSDMLGVGRVGAGVNSVVSGVGDGFGSALSGVSSGTGKIFKGAGQGIGHAFGGVAGGALQIGKGIGKGLTKGDGKAVVNGFSQGMASVGGGLVVGAESAVVGAADGVLSAGRGIFSGVKSVGLGIGGAFTGKKPEKKDHHHKKGSS